METQKTYIVLEGIKIRNRFYTTNTPDTDHTKSAEGDEWYKIIGYANTGDEARRIIRTAPRTLTTFIFKLWDGARNSTRELKAESYVDAVAQTGSQYFPPSYIWSIEPK